MFVIISCHILLFVVTRCYLLLFVIIDRYYLLSGVCYSLFIVCSSLLFVVE